LPTSDDPTTPQHQGPRRSTHQRVAGRLGRHEDEIGDTAGLEPIAIETHDACGPAGRRIEREPEIVVTSESGAFSDWGQSGSVSPFVLDQTR
jgi:hypothetical protein